MVIVLGLTCVVRVVVFGLVVVWFGLVNWVGCLCGCFNVVCFGLVVFLVGGLVGGCCWVFVMGWLCCGLFCLGVFV